MASGNTLTVSVVSATSQVWEGEAKSVVARSTEGEMGILPGHEPVLAMLGAGEVRITDAEGQSTTALANDGFLSVAQDRVTIVAREASLSA